MKKKDAYDNVINNYFQKTDDQKRKLLIPCE